MSGQVFSVHGQPDFAAVYDEDEMIEIRRGDLRALLDLATQSMDFGSGFWNNEDTEIARKVAVILGIDPTFATPPGEMTRVYVCMGGKGHIWKHIPARLPGIRESATFGTYMTPGSPESWFCLRCHHQSATKPEDYDQ